MTENTALADTAAALINGDHLDDCLAGEETGEYEQLLRCVRRAVNGFGKDAEPFDDPTMLCIRRLGASETQGNEDAGSERIGAV